MNMLLAAATTQSAIC